MNNVIEETSISYKTKGQRLSHILDVAGFKHGHGRMSEFQVYLASKRSEVFHNLKYTTVKAWFSDSSPPMDKISLIIDTLSKDYKFDNDLNFEQVKSWWKVGGYYPFTKEKNTNQKRVSNNEIDLMQAIKRVDSVYVGQVHLLIYQIASELDINLTHDIERNVLGSVFTKVVTYCQENTLEIDSPELKELIKSILHLAKENLL
ncbi:MAG: hypothetical protein QM504_12030 [Pseudomonadota bacterium]